MTLTPTQLRALTGKVRRSDQEAWLLERRHLMQHSSVSLTSKHYRTRADQLRPVR